MMNDDRPYIAPGVSGWSKREAAAKARQARSERHNENAAAQRRQREFEDALSAHVNQAKAEGRDKDEAYREFVESWNAGEAPQSPEAPEPDVAPPEPEKEPVEPERQPEPDSETESLPDPEDMDRDALIAELEAAGERVHPASKDATLRRKVEALR